GSSQNGAGILLQLTDADCFVSQYLVHAHLAKTYLCERIIGHSTLKHTIINPVNRMINSSLSFQSLPCYAISTLFLASEFTRAFRVEHVHFAPGMISPLLFALL
ncbi:hypothetical protein, partial [Paludibacterium sp.]|uniref:hypothetical protein n=1 Tax=Paludibacterium sp. TaxID=1917523 RepID=UPI0025DF4543